MNEVIMQLSSSYIYDNILVAGQKNKNIAILKKKN